MTFFNFLRRPPKTPKPIQLYEKEVSQKNAQFSQKQPSVPFKPLGSLQNVRPTKRGALLQMENGFLRLAFLTPDLLQVRIRPDDNFGDLFPFSYAIDKTDWGDVEINLEQDEDSISIGTGAITCHINRSDGHFSLLSPDGTPVIQNAGDGFSQAGGKVRWTRQLPKNETCYGLGQRASGLNLRGKKLALWNTDPLPYRRDHDPIYYSIPFYFGYQNQVALGIFWDNPSRGSVDLGKTRLEQMIFEAEAGEICFYFMISTAPAVILDRFTALTGRPYLPPVWALGYQQSRWSYKSSEEFRHLASQFRQRRIPCDVLYFDIDYMDGFRCFTWDPINFGDLPELLSELGEQGFRSVAMLDPGIKFDPGYAAFDAGEREDIFMKYPDGSLYTGVVWPDTCAFPDFTNPDGREWWAGQVVDFLAKAPFDGIWNDMNEPVVFTRKEPNTFPDYLPHHWEGNSITHVEGGHNVYGMQMARSTREGLEKAYPDRRPFTLTRDGYAGAQRYCSSWTGDNGSTWDHLRLSISMLLNLGLSGVPFTGPDIGGFFDAPDGELFTRWMQLGSMMPYFRTHTHKDTPRQEPWSFGAANEAIIRRYIELRYRLLPYIYSAMATAHHHGIPVIRPSFFHDPADPALRGQDDAFMVGDTLFVAPVLEAGVTQRSVYLPRGLWYDFWTNQQISGGQVITVNAPLEVMPIFALAGKMLPMWEVQQYVGESALEDITLRLYSGAGETSVYEDAGEGKGYQGGEYRFSYFTALNNEEEYGINWRTAGGYKPSYEKVHIEVVGISGEPDEIIIDRRPAPLWYYEKNHLEVVTAPFRELRMNDRQGNRFPPVAKA